MVVSIKQGRAAFNVEGSIGMTRSRLTRFLRRARLRNDKTEKMAYGFGTRETYPLFFANCSAISCSLLASAGCPVSE
jgi:hypothetical protein